MTGSAIFAVLNVASTFALAVIVLSVRWTLDLGRVAGALQTVRDLLGESASRLPSRFESLATKPAHGLQSVLAGTHHAVTRVNGRR